MQPIKNMLLPFFRCTDLLVQNHPGFTCRADAAVRSVDHFEKLRHALAFRRISCVGCSRQISDECKAFRFFAVTEVSAEAYSMNTFWQDMEHEASDEFRSAENHLLLPAVVRIVLVGKRYSFSGDIRYSCIADRSTISIAGEVFDGITVAVEGFFDKGNPVFSVE